MFILTRQQSLVESINPSEVFLNKNNKKEQDEVTGKGVKNVASDISVSAFISDHCLDTKTTGLHFLLLFWTSEEV